MVFQIVLPLYGLVDVSDAWWRTLDCFLVQDLELLQCFSEPCLFFVKKGSPPDVIVVDVDDAFFAGGRGTHTARSIGARIEQKFPCKLANDPPFPFPGGDVNRLGGMTSLGQRSYCSWISMIPDSATFIPFPRLRHRLAWRGITPPEISASINILAQVRADTPNPTHVKTIEKTVAHAKCSSLLGLTFPCTNPDTLHIVAYSGASLA